MDYLQRAGDDDRNGTVSGRAGNIETPKDAGTLRRFHCATDVKPPAPKQAT
jgi:hypothetical protein